MGERELLAWLEKRLREATGRCRIGDDVAELTSVHPLAITVDSQIEGVHFAAGTPLPTVARRLLAVNLSDLAASAATPRWAFLTLSAPPRFDHRTFLEAFVAAAVEWKVELAGGDLARAGQLVTSLTLVGEIRGASPRRSRARAGDRLWIGGELGVSALGRALLERLPARDDILGEGPRLVHPEGAQRAIRRHLAPEPQLDLGAWLGGRDRAAAIDVSDGLTVDLDRLCEASGVGATIELETLPFPPELRPVAAALGLDPTSLMLEGGEDYVLLFALPEGDAPPARFGCLCLGQLTAERGLRARLAGKETALTPGGWDHLDSTAPAE